MWTIVEKSYPIWYFDATGNTFKKIRNQTDPLTYSIVFHDFSRKTIMPICDFVTTNHTSDNISVYLKILRDILASYGNLIPQFIVTDFCYALINAIMTIFNSTTIGHYLEWCFKYQINGNFDLKNCMKMRLYLCSTHILKLIIKKTKAIKTADNVQEFFIRCFCLLQNSLTINQFNIFLFNMINIFCNPYADESINISLIYMRDQIKSSESVNLEDLVNIMDQDDENDEKIKFLFYDNETIDNIKKNSPFRIYFDDLIKQYRSELNLNLIRKKKKVENDFFCEALFSIIDDKLHLMPLWTGLMIGEYKAYSVNEFISKQTRFTNNSVESYFTELKHSIFNNQNNLLTSEMAAKCFNRILAKYIEMFNNRSEVPNYNFEEKKKHLSNSTEKWKKKGKKQSSGVKGFYFKKLDTWNLIKDKILDKKENTKETKKQEDDECSISRYKILFSDMKRLYNDQINHFESFDQIEQKFTQNRTKIVECVKILRSIKESKFFDDQIDDPQFNFILLKNKMNFMVPIWCSPDGNCFWYSISNLLFGSDHLFYLIKVSSIFMLLEYKSEMDKILNRFDYDMSCEKLIEKTMQANEYANELNIFATCIAINRPIYSFGGSDQEITYNQKYELECNKLKKPLNLGYFHSHFVALLSKEKNFFQNNIEYESFAQIKKIIKFKKYE